MNKKALSIFGEIVIHDVRDYTISVWDKHLTGQMKGIKAEKVKQIIAGVSQENIEAFAKLVPGIVDTALHNFMVALEQNEALEVTIQTESGKSANLRDLSDGLPGELFGPNGWISLFSKERHEESYD